MLQGNSKESPILAAGGIVSRPTESGDQFAIIHRKRHGDYCLPKGHLQDGECFIDAALREVCEETGSAAVIGPFVGPLEYTVEGNPKIVLFWAMRHCNESSTEVDREEVEEVLWLSASEAARRLDHSGETRMLQQLMSPSERMASFSIFERIWPPNRHYQRIKRNVESFRSELDERLRKTNHDPTWGITAHRLLETVDHFVRQRDIEGAWHCLHAAQRSIVYAYSNEERIACATVLRLEAKKIASWRCQAIEHLLGADANSVDATSLHVALKVRDEYSDNQYHRIWLLRDQLRNLVVITSVALVIFIATSTSTSLPDASPWDFRVLVAILCFGILGASFSAARSITGESSKSKIPEQVANKWITLARTVLGATPALAAYAFLNSNILNLGPISVEKTLAVAFVAGFSERLVLKAIETVAGKDESQNKT